MKAEILISNSAGKAFIPNVEGDMVLSTKRTGAAGRLTFKMIEGKGAKFSEGAAVQLWADGKGLFFGYVFSKENDEQGAVYVTAYDGLRYLGNKDTYVYENKTASQLVRMIAEDYGLKTGTVEDTKVVIPYRVEENTTLLDMIESALEITLSGGGGRFVLFDDFGKLSLKNISSMLAGENGAYLLIDGKSGEGFRYSSSIDKGTYNSVKLMYSNKRKGVSEVYTARNDKNISRWGMLRYFGTVSEEENGQAKADTLLKLYNRENRLLRVRGAFGDYHVRGGSVAAVRLDVGGRSVDGFMLVESAVHRIGDKGWFMDLELSGG